MGTSCCSDKWPIVAPLQKSSRHSTTRLLIEATLLSATISSPVIGAVKSMIATWRRKFNGTLQIHRLIGHQLVKSFALANEA